MRFLFSLIIGSLINIPAIFAQGLPRLDMWEEPSHQLVYKDDTLRILDVRIVPEVTSGFHKHDFATTYIVIQDANLTNQNYGQKWSKATEKVYRKPGAAQDMSGYVADNSYHRVKNIDDVAFHLVAIVNLNDGDASLGKKELKEDGELISNPWFQEHRVKLNAGKTSDQLTFGNDVVLVQYDDVPSYVIEKGVKHSYKSLRGAFSMHKKGTSFQIVNDGSQTTEFILIEVVR